MKITYVDAVSNVNTYILNSKNFEKDLSIETSENLNIPSAIMSVQMLDDVTNLPMKIDFVYTLLKDNGVTIKHKDNVLCTFRVTEGMRFDDIELFKTSPAIYRYFIDAIFGIFLKNSYPLLSESREAE